MNYSIWIKKSALDLIFTNAREWLPTETGGILIGYRASDEHLVITDVIGPGENSVHRTTSFEPDQAFHQKEIARIYNETTRLQTYLGDWHTHPNSYPYLSGRDKITLHAIAGYRDARLKNPLMLVASPPAMNFKVWLYEKRNKPEKISYVQCEIIVF